MQEEIFQPETIVRIKRTGEFGKIKKRCWCGGWNTPLHYEVWVEKNEKLEIICLDHDMLELECLPWNS